MKPKKKLFKNYSFNFDKNEKKILTTFCKQSVTQMSADERFSQEINVFNSIIDKLVSDEDEIKFTKMEKTKLAYQLSENAKSLEERIEKSWFIKKWLYRSMYNQYNSILQNHFED